MNLKKVSIIIPAYNCESCINECLESLLIQQQDIYEIIIINDGSTDKTLDVCSHYASKNKKIKLLNQKNSGVSSARNSGIIFSSGDYIIFIDADDKVDNGFIKEMLATEADFVLCGAKLFDGFETKNEYKCIAYSGSITDFCDLIEQWLNPPLLLSPWAKMFSTKIVKENNILFDETMSYGEDAVFVFSYLLACKTVFCLPMSYYNYRISISGSLSNSFNESMYKNCLKINDSFNALLKKNDCKLDAANNLASHDFTGCTRKLIMSKTPRSQKRNIFTNYYHFYKAYLKSKKKKTGSEKLVCFVGNNPSFFFLLNLFRLRNLFTLKSKNEY